MLENVGIAFRDDPVALQIWRDAGVTPGGPHGDLIRADASWICSLCATAPRQFTQLARNPERSVIIGGDNQVLHLYMARPSCAIWKVAAAMPLLTISKSC